MTMIASAWQATGLITPVQRRRKMRRRLMLADAASIVAAAVAAYWLRSSLTGVGGLAPFANEVPFAVAVLPVWIAVLHAAGAYRPHDFASVGAGMRRFVAGVVGGGVVLGFVSFLFSLQVSRLYVAMLLVVATALGGTARLVLRARQRRRWHRGEGVQRVLIVGVDEESLAVAAAMGRLPEAGFRVVGFVDHTLPTGWPVLGDAEVVGTPGDDTARLAQRLGAGLVVVTPTAVEPGTLRMLTVALEGSEIDLAIAPSLFEVVTRRVTVDSIGNVPLLHVEQIRLEGARAFAKRALDVAGSVLLLALLWPVMMAAAVAVRLDSPGPVLFRQRRVGKDGREFSIYKFRTMAADAEDRLAVVAELNEVGHHFFKIRRDPRVTRVGRFLRKWSIDETPQLWNVLRGQMALVGPRPPLPAEVAHYQDWHMRRLRVRPGLTGLWQVSGRSEVPFDEAVRLDLFYIENWSLGLDLSILARTVRAVLGADGAY